jgi:hypothetical protein
MNNSGIVREGFAREKVTDHKGSSRSQLGSPVRKVFKIKIVKGISSRNVYFFSSACFYDINYFRGNLSSNLLWGSCSGFSLGGCDPKNYFESCL